MEALFHRQPAQSGQALQVFGVHHAHQGADEEREREYSAELHGGGDTHHKQPLEQIVFWNEERRILVWRPLQTGYTLQTVGNNRRFRV